LEKGKNKPLPGSQNPYVALANLKVSKKDKYAWIAVAVSIAVLLLCWWARNSTE
jgi:hypothetical protein